MSISIEPRTQWREAAKNVAGRASPRHVGFAEQVLWFIIWRLLLLVYIPAAWSSRVRATRFFWRLYGWAFFAWLHGPNGRRQLRFGIVTGDPISPWW